MSHQADHYLRLQCLLSESCKVLRDVFNQKSRNDARPGRQFSDLDTYLSFHKQTIEALVRKKVLRQAQYERLFPKSPSKAITVKEMDITMLSTLLTNIFNPLPSMEEKSISAVRDERNYLNHYYDITAMTDTEFKGIWNKLEIATDNLASIVNPDYKSTVSKVISELKDKTITPSVQDLLEIIKSLSTANHVNDDVIKSLRLELQELKRSTGKTESILRNTTKVTYSDNGKPIKRMKIEDKQLDMMKKRFAKTMRNNNGESPKDEEIETMYKKLKESRLLYVTGSSKSPYEETVIGVMKRLCIDETKCVEMKDLTEWTHVYPDDVKLVWIRNPLRNPLRQHTLHPKTIEELHKYLDDIDLELTYEAGEDSQFIVITFDLDIHHNYIATLKMSQVDPHRLLLEPLEYQKSENSQNNAVISDFCPSDISERTIGTGMLFYKGQLGYTVLQNLKDQTKIYMNDYKDDKLVPGYDQAKKILLEKKVLRINGPRASGKSILAVKLLSNFSEERCLLLHDPSNLIYVCLDDVSIVLIDNVGGKYGYDRDQTVRWYNQFDFLHKVVQAGSLSMIVITDDCVLPNHWILSTDHTLTLPKLAQQDATFNDGLTYPSNSKPRSLWNASFERIHTENIARDHYVNSPIFLPDGRFIYATRFSDEEIVLMDSDLSQTLSKLELERCANDICVMSNTEVIITHKNQNLQFINVLTNELTLGEKIDLGDDVFCYSIDVLKGEIYIVCEVATCVYVRILDRHGQVRKQIRLSIIEYEERLKIKVGKSGDKIFLSFDCSSQLVCLSKEGHVLFTFPNYKTGRYDNEILGPFDMYVDDNDDVLVSCFDSDKIHLINSDGTQYKVLIEAQEASDRPLRHFSYRESDGCLVVESDEGLLVYKASW